MKQRRTKLRKFLIRTLLFLMLFMGTVGVLSRSKTVQTYLAQQAASWLSKELGVKVEIKSLEFDFFRNIHIEGLFIEDKHHDTLIALQAANIVFTKYDGIKRVVKFENANLLGAAVNIGYYKGEESKNIQFLLDYLQGPPRPKNTPKKLWTIDFSKAQLTNSSFCVFDEERMSTEPGLLDEANLEFRKINGRISDLVIVDDSFHFEAVELKTVERSGLTIRKLNAICNMHDKGMDFTEMDLFTECSHVEGEIHWTYPGFKYLDKFVSNTNWDAKLVHSDLCLSEMSVFSEDLKQNPAVLKINKVDIKGTYDKLFLSKADVNFGKNSRIRGDFYLEGLPNWRTTYCEFNVISAITSAADIEHITESDKLPDLVYDAGNISGSGKFIGQFLDFKWNGDLTSAFGSARTDVLMNFKPGLDNAVFSGNISTTGLDLSHFNSNLGRSVFDIKLNGTGLNARTFNLKADAVIPEFVLFGKTYVNAKVENGKLNSKNFTGKMSLGDLRINSDFDGLIDFSGALPKFKFSTISRGLDLMELGLDTIHTLVWGKTNVDFMGIEPDEIQGYVDLSELYIHRGGEVYEYDFQHFEKYGSTKHLNIKMNGDFATGNIQGRLSLNNVSSLVINSLADIFPDKILRQNYSGKDSFKFNFVIHDPSIIYSVIFPGLSTDPLVINGDFDGTQGLAFAELQQINLEYQGYAVHNFEVHTNRDKDSTLRFNASALSFYNQGNLQLQNMAIAGTAKHNSASYNLKFADKSNKYTVDISAISDILKDSITLNFVDSEIKMDAENWNLDEESRLVFMNDGTIKVPHLYLDGNEHFIEAKGVISARSSDTLMLDMGNFNFDFVRPYIANTILDSLEGRLNGNVQIAAVLGWPRFSGEVNARDLKYYSVHYGDADIQLTDLEKTGRLQLKADFFNGLVNGISVNGNVGYKKVPGVKQLNLLVEIPETSQLGIIQPFLVDVLTVKGGNVNGQINVSGDFDAIKVTGNLAVKQAITYIDYLKTAYKFDADFFINSRGLFTSKKVVMHDETNTGVALGSIAIMHKNFDDFYLDVKIDSARNLKCLNTKEGDDDIFYGTAWADGDCHIYGPFEKISMDINLKSRKNSKVHVLYSDVEENELLGYIRFVKRSVNKQDSVLKKENNVIHKIAINLELNTDLEAEFIIDKRLGDAIKGKGYGNLKMLYDENEHFYLFGTYRVEEGDYVFSIPGINLITKKVALQQGGSIIWSGDPYNALINMTGSFEKKISPAALMTAVSGGAQKSYSPIRVRSILYISGNLMSPEIGFDIQVPDLENSGVSSTNDVYRVIQRIRADKDETMKQAVSLLLFGNFITPSFAQNSATTNGVVSGTGVAGNSLSQLASTVVNDIFARAGIPTRIQVNIDDVRNNSGGQAAKVFVNSEWFLTERVRLDVNYDPTVAVLVNNVALPINFNLEYMTRNENLRFKAFSRSSNLLSQQSATTLNSGVSGNTLGAGLVYRREFETFKRTRKIADTTSF